LRAPIPRSALTIMLSLGHAQTGGGIEITGLPSRNAAFNATYEPMGRLVAG
jgi:hypothetical protein